MSFGYPRVNQTDKFYKGSTKATPWNNELLWSKYVDKLTRETAVPLTDRLKSIQKTGFIQVLNGDGYQSRGTDTSRTSSSRLPRILGSSAKVKKQLERLKESEKQRRKSYEEQLRMLKAQLEILKKKDSRDDDF
jgi:hypothetical protein